MDNKKKRKLTFMTIFLISALVGSLVGGLFGYLHSELRLTCSATGDYDYIEFYDFEGNNETVGNLVFRLTSYEQEIVHKPYFKYSVKTLQMQIFKDGSYNIGFIQMDRQQINTVSIHNVTVTISLYLWGGNSFDTSDSIGITLMGAMFGLVGGFLVFALVEKRIEARYPDTEEDIEAEVEEEETGLGVLFD